MFPFLLLFALLLISTLVWRRRRHLARWDHFPGPKGSQSLPFVGHSYMLASEGPITKMLSMRRQYGDVFRLDLGPTPTVVVADYDLAVEIHRHEVSYIRYNLAAYRTAGPARFLGLKFTSSGRILAEYV